VTPPRVDQIYKTDAAIVRAVRVFHGLDQAQFAAKLLTVRRTVIRWEQRGVFFSRAPWNPQAQAWAELLKPYLQAQAPAYVRAQAKAGL
jgi:hypothetical protein